MIVTSPPGRASTPLRVFLRDVLDLVASPSCPCIRPLLQVLSRKFSSFGMVRSLLLGRVVAVALPQLATISRVNVDLCADSVHPLLT